MLYLVDLYAILRKYRLCIDHLDVAIDDLDVKLKLD